MINQKGGDSVATAASSGQRTARSGWHPVTQFFRTAAGCSV